VNAEGLSSATSVHVSRPSYEPFDAVGIRISIVSKFVRASLLLLEWVVDVVLLCEQVALNLCVLEQLKVSLCKTPSAGLNKKRNTIQREPSPKVVECLLIWFAMTRCQQRGVHTS
jgi:hypothetical protein